MNREAGTYNDGHAFNNNQLRILETVIMLNPNIFLDEIADALGKETAIYLNYSTHTIF